MEPRRTISIVTPAFNEEASLAPLCQRLQAMFAATPYDYQIVVVDNGSSDGSLALLRELHAADPRVEYVSLCRNFGHQGGILAGLAHARGDAVVVMDADLQHPPEVVPRLLARWEEGYKIVHTRSTRSGRWFLRRAANALYYRALERLFGARIGRSDFRLMDRVVVDQLNHLPESEKFVRGLVTWLGWPAATVPFEEATRLHGTSRLSAAELSELAFLGVASFSVYPLRLMFLLGLLLFVPSVLYLGYVLVTGLLNVLLQYRSSLPPGWATITVAILFFGSFNLIALGVLGEYVGRIYQEVKARPAFLVKEATIRREGAP